VGYGKAHEYLAEAGDFLGNLCLRSRALPHAQYAYVVDRGDDFCGGAAGGDGAGPLGQLKTVKGKWKTLL